MAIHLFDSEIECLNLFILVVDLSFEGSLLVDQLFGVVGLGLHDIVMLNVGHGLLGGLVFNLLLVHYQQVLKLLVLPLILDLELVESVLIVPPQLESFLNFLS